MSNLLTAFPENLPHDQDINRQQLAMLVLLFLPLALILPVVESNNCTIISLYCCPLLWTARQMDLLSPAARLEGIG
jgi:hypothetical protein